MASKKQEKKYAYLTVIEQSGKLTMKVFMLSEKVFKVIEKSEHPIFDLANANSRFVEEPLNFDDDFGFALKWAEQIAKNENRELIIDRVFFDIWQASVKWLQEKLNSNRDYYEKYNLVSKNTVQSQSWNQ